MKTHLAGMTKATSPSRQGPFPTRPANVRLRRRYARALARNQQSTGTDLLWFAIGVLVIFVVSMVA